MKLALYLTVFIWCAAFGVKFSQWKNAPKAIETRPQSIVFGAGQFTTGHTEQWSPTGKVYYSGPIPEELQVRPTTMGVPTANKIRSCACGIHDELLPAPPRSKRFGDVIYNTDSHHLFVVTPKGELWHDVGTATTSTLSYTTEPVQTARTSP